jgi:hypothetical protein
VKQRLPFGDEIVDLFVSAAAPLDDDLGQFLVVMLGLVFFGLCHGKRNLAFLLLRFLGDRSFQLGCGIPDYLCVDHCRLGSLTHVARRGASRQDQSYE